MRILTLLLAPLLAAAPAQRSRKRPAPEPAPVLREDITVRSRAAVGPAVKLPAPAADPAVLGEVIDALDIVRVEPRAAPTIVPLEAAARRLALPFPQPPFLVFSPGQAARYDRWAFQILDGPQTVWQAQGSGPLAERIEWDGTDAAGAMAAVAGRSYRFRFTALRGGEDYAVESEPVRLDSFSYREFMGEQRLEAANALLFEKGDSELRLEAEPYLAALAERMRRVALREHDYQLVLYQPQPGSPLARKRARALTAALARRLLIAPARIAVDLQTAGQRGDVTTCILPPEQGLSIRVE